MRFSFAGWSPSRAFAADLAILTRIAFGALPVRAAELDEEHPGHDERDACHHGAGQWFTEEKP